MCLSIKAIFVFFFVIPVGESIQQDQTGIQSFVLVLDTRFRGHLNAH